MTTNTIIYNSQVYTYIFVFVDLLVCNFFLSSKASSEEMSLGKRGILSLLEDIVNIIIN